MVRHEINIYIEPEFRSSIKTAWLKAMVVKVLDALELSAQSEIGLVITNDNEIQRLNKLYRDIDKPTDVLSFAQLPNKVDDVKGSMFIAPPDGFSHLGEIIISFPQAVIQANHQKHDVKDELMFLIIHAVLHLSGYDHENSASEEGFMRAKEAAIFAKLTTWRVRNKKD